MNKNPILLDYRMDIEHTTWRDRDPLDWLAEVTGPGVWLDGHPWSDAEVEHARKVFHRLSQYVKEV